jgi:hypothetical protein
MTFRIHALPAETFADFFQLSDAELAAVRAVRMKDDAKPGYPCRVSLADAEIGETVILVNYEHQPADSPYRSSHALFVRQGAAQAHPVVGEVPEMLATRLISVRAFDEKHYMVDADVVAGSELEAAIPAMLVDQSVAYLHLHNARQGCFAASCTRV